MFHYKLIIITLAIIDHTNNDYSKVMINIFVNVFPRIVCVMLIHFMVKQSNFKIPLKSIVHQKLSIYKLKKKKIRIKKGIHILLISDYNIVWIIFKN